MILRILVLVEGSLSVFVRDNSLRQLLAREALVKLISFVTI